MEYSVSVGARPACHQIPLCRLTCWLTTSRRWLDHLSKRKLDACDDDASVQKRPATSLPSASKFGGSRKPTGVEANRAVAESVYNLLRQQRRLPRSYMPSEMVANTAIITIGGDIYRVRNGYELSPVGSAARYSVANIAVAMAGLALGWTMHKTAKELGMTSQATHSGQVEILAELITTRFVRGVWAAGLKLSGPGAASSDSPIDTADIDVDASGSASTADKTANGPGGGADAPSETSPHVGGTCPTCGMPEETSSYWDGVPDADRLCCDSCRCCGMPMIPTSVSEAAAMVRARQLGQSDGLAARKADPLPRPHEDAVAQQTDATKAMASILQRAQKLEWRAIVDGAGALTGERPVMLQCDECKTEYYFDFVWGGMVRMGLGASKTKGKPTGRTTAFLDNPSRLEVLNEIAPKVTETLTSDEGRRKRSLTVQWSCCTNCEAKRILEENRKEGATGAGLKQVAAKTGMPTLCEHVTELGVPLVVDASALPGVPLRAPGQQTAAGAGDFVPDVVPGARYPSWGTRSHAHSQEQAAEPTPTATFDFHARCGVLLFHREKVAPFLEGLKPKDVAESIGEPLDELLSPHAVRFGTAARIRAAAGGDESDVNTGTAWIMPTADIERLMALPPQDRAEALLSRLRDANVGTVEHIATWRLDVGGSVELARRLERDEGDWFGMYGKPTTGAALGGDEGVEGGEEGEDGEGEKEAEAEEGDRGEGGGGKSSGPSAGGESEGGRMGRWRTFAPLLMSADFADYVAQPGKDGEVHARHTFAFAKAGKAGRLLMMYPCKDKGRPAPGLKVPSRDGHSETSAPCHGQPRFYDLLPSRPMLDVKRRNNAKFQEASAAARTLNAAMATAAVETMLLLAALGLAPAPGAGAKHSDPGPQKTLLGAALHRSAVYTWDVFADSASKDEAIEKLSHVKGYYRNGFPCFGHFDADVFMETATLRCTREIAPGDRQPAATLVPQLGLLIDLEPNKTVVTLGLERLLHATERREGIKVPVHRSVGEVYNLQSRGRKEKG